MTGSKMYVAAFLTALAMLGVRAQASTIPFNFTASLDTGALAGTHFTGTGSYDSTNETGVGQEYLTLITLDFTVDGVTFNRAGIGQGGQAILNNGVLSYFTAAYFPSSGPIDDIAFGFGGPGIIGYSVPPGFNPGQGQYAFTNVTATPEPSALILCGIGLLLIPVALRAGKVSSPLSTGPTWG